MGGALRWETAGVVRLFAPAAYRGYQAHCQRCVWQPIVNSMHRPETLVLR